jgi:hypothetical protein
MTKSPMIVRYLAKFVAAPTVANAKTLRYRISNFPADRAKLGAEDQTVLDAALKMLQERGE